MKLKTILIILITVFAIGTAGLGMMLSNEIILDTQELGVFPGTTFFEGGFSCVCIDEGESVSCDFEPGTPGKLLCG